MLLVSSTDGFCTIVVFDKGEIGEHYIPKESSPASCEVKDSKQSSPAPSTASSKVTVVLKHTFFHLQGISF